MPNRSWNRSEWRVRTRFGEVRLRADRMAAARDPAGAALVADLRFELMGDGKAAWVLAAVRTGALTIDGVAAPPVPPDLDLPDPDADPPFWSRVARPDVFIGFQVRDDAGRPVAARFRLKLPGGHVGEGTVPADGQVMFRRLPRAGEATLVLLDGDGG